MIREDDIEIINTELAQADLETVERAADRVRRMAGSGDKEAVALMALLDEVAAIAAKEGAPVVPICNRIEAEVAEREEFLEALGIDQPGLNGVIRAGYSLLGLHHYFTAGPKEARPGSFPSAPGRRKPPP